MGMESANLVPTTVSFVKGGREGTRMSSRGDRVKETLEAKKKRGEPVGRPPFGLTTDKQKHDADEAREYLPKDEKQDDFKTAIRILNEYAYIDAEPGDEDAPPPGTIGREYGLASPTDTVRAIWDKRRLYKKVAEKHRDDLAILF